MVLYFFILPLVRRLELNPMGLSSTVPWSICSHSHLWRNTGFLDSVMVKPLKFEMMSYVPLQNLIGNLILSKVIEKVRRKLKDYFKILWYFSGITVSFEWWDSTLKNKTSKSSIVESSKYVTVAVSFCFGSTESKLGIALEKKIKLKYLLFWYHPSSLPTSILFSSLILPQWIRDRIWETCLCLYTVYISVWFPPLYMLIWNLHSKSFNSTCRMKLFLI